MTLKQQIPPFCGTPAQEETLLSYLGEWRDSKAPLIPILQKAQEIYGYLPIEVQTMIADEIGIPLEKVYGVVTFYSQFSLVPKGRHQISVCMGTACYVKGAGEILQRVTDYLGIQNGECTPDGKFSIEPCRCVGACGLAPVMMIDGHVYGRLTPEDIEGILAKYE